MANRGVLELSLILLLGCPADDDEPEGAFLPDDDGPEQVQDDDDSSADDDNPDEEGMLRLWRVDRRVRVAGQDDRIEGLAGAALGAPGPWPSTVALPDGTPLPGLALQPEGELELDSCETLNRDTGWGDLPPGDAAGTLVITSQAGLSAPLTLSADSGHFSGQSEFDGVSTGWDLEASGVDGLVDGPVASFAAPLAPSNTLPSPGPINLLGPLSVSWTATGADAVEILLLRFASPVDTQNWEALRCRVIDDGVFVFQPIELAGPGTGGLVLSVTTAEWSTNELFEAVSSRVLSSEASSG